MGKGCVCVRVTQGHLVVMKREEKDSMGDAENIIRPVDRLAE